jgi:hypothetical protein
MIADAEELASEVEFHFRSRETDAAKRLRLATGRSRSAHWVQRLPAVGRQVTLLKQRGMSRVSVQLVLVSPGRRPHGPSSG